jgi:HlyD family secretion protein
LGSRSSAGTSSSTADYITAAATRTTVADDVVATGTVTAHATYGLSFGSAPQLALGTSTSNGGGGTAALVQSVDVKVGDRVTAGQVLATAATADLDVQLAIARANLAVAKARLIADQGGPTADVKAAAQEAIDQAQLPVRIDHLRTSTAPEQLTRAGQGAVKQAEDDLAKAEAGPSSDIILSAQDSLTAGNCRSRTLSRT